MNIQHYKFMVDCYIIPVQVVDIVLRVWWLQLLGQCLMNYKYMTMEFTLQGI